MGPRMDYILEEGDLGLKKIGSDLRSWEIFVDHYLELPGDGIVPEGRKSKSNTEKISEIDVGGRVFRKINKNLT